MFITDTFIDSIQTAKKEAVKTLFGKNETVAKSLTEFVDAQTAYTKGAVKAGTDVATKLASETVKYTQEAAKFDYAKHMTDAFGSFTKAFEVSKK